MSDEMDLMVQLRRSIELARSGRSEVTPADTYRRHAVPLSAAESALWDRPAAEESLVERIAMGMYVLTEAAEMCEWPDADQQLWLDCAQVAIDIMAGRTS